VYWDDQPHNYSRENKNKVRNYFANKYGVAKNNINVIYRPVKFNEKGDAIEITGAGIENIMDVNYQRSLMKELITRDNKNVDFNRIIALDDKVNGELNVDLTTSQHRSWSIKWVMVDNFLSFGENNYVPFNKLRGLTVVNSIPANQGGKTTLTIDAIKFLLHGTTTKTDTNEQIFNTYSEKNELVVRGMIDIEGEETIIERKMRRSAKKGGGWTVVNKVNYYRLLPDGDEEELNEEDAKQTTKKLKETIGSEKDFEMLVLATEKNLDDLIGLTTTESGKVLTRLIGLEILELKEAAARTMYNEFARKKKSNDYDVITLGEEIIDHEEKIVLGEELEVSLTKKLEQTKEEIIKLSNENDRLLNSKEKIDVTITSLNPSALEEDIAVLTKKGVSFLESKNELLAKISKIGVVNFDEDKHHELTKSFNTNTTNKALKEAEIARLEKVVSGLIAGGICQSCNRKLDDVDNSEHIAKHELEIEKLRQETLNINSKLTELTSQLEVLNGVKLLVDEKNKLELSVDRADVEMGSLRNKITEKKNDLKKYNLNLEAIELNKKVDIEVSKVKTDLSVCEHTKDDTITRIERVQTDIKSHKSNIETKTKLIETIKKEEEIDKIFKIYIDLVGKKGISKLVLRSVLPIINSEAQRLLEDVVDFEIEIFMNEKNDVQFLLNKDGVSKLLKSGSGLEKTASSLALRAVLGKLSTLPMPNFITFDEVLGKVAPENIEKLKNIFDKIKDMYEIVFFITHNDLVKDWGDNVVTVIKDSSNISKITIK
jgi:DNA repair exonuclease SbcCD ATPase subunit